MTYRSFVWREMGWRSAAAVLASVGLAACPGGGGGSGCPDIGGTWTVSGTCVDTGGITCTVDQNSCSVTLNCTDGRTLTGSVSKSSINFRDEEVSCSGSLDNTEDDDGDGVVSPEIDGTCTPTGAAMCDIAVTCQSGDCTIPEDEDDGNDEGDSGQGGSSGFLGGGNGGVSGGDSGEGGDAGDGPAGAGGFSGTGGFGGISGQGGISGEGGGPSGAGGVGGSVPSGTCGDCASSACASQLASCSEANGCAPVAECVIESGCYFDDDVCLESSCTGTEVGLTEEGNQAFIDALSCTARSCQDSCPITSEPIGGAGGAGGAGGEPAPRPCDSCEWANDGVCDVPDYCEAGTDCSDCGE